MIKNWFRHSNSGDTHPAEEMFLRYVDGELSSRESGGVRSHLETCWSCRLSLEKIEETISAFVEFRQQIQIPLTPPPPKNWNNFDNKLNALVTSSPTSKTSWWSGQRNKIGRFFNSFVLSPAVLIGQRKTAFGALAALLVAVLIWQLVIVRPISAGEVLDRSLQMQKEQIATVQKAVVYQKLKIRRNGLSEINWEVWRDTTSSRFRQNVTSGVNAAFDQELWNILDLNDLDGTQPLSTATFVKWRNGLPAKSDTVEQTKTADGGGIIVLKTSCQSETSPGKIGEASLTLRAGDLHPIGQILKVRSADGIQTYEFTELDYRVQSLTAFAPDFFATPETPQVAANVGPVLAKTAEANANSNVANSNVAPKAAPVTFAPASADLEVEIFSLLNKAGADLGEQIMVNRGSDGRLNVRGLVDTANRKNEILTALAAVRDNPSVELEIKTVDEAVAEQKSISRVERKAETVESRNSSTATDTELLNYFKSEAAARQFGGQMIAHSDRVMARVYALKRLMGQFRPEEMRSLSPEARNKLLALVRSHASALRGECEGLDRELQPVFGPATAGALATADVGDVTSLPRAIEALATLASTNDQIIHSAFALSSRGAGFSAIRTSQFWQSLRSAEALAGKLESVK